ncbi:type II secretion system F family protein [Vibrio caribbeanicus]|uniref:Flp pilus assembly protein TadB, putative n=1 Tax=Vibrio caribbeanicus ATCC BAA-2122 TaxID=796620 RepID=E3BLF8_9VIBR|nr:type II secretion system F family protein [Vibrio caribbeanicus]EFP96040.1 Flp pilus assembly protein TadB, putative [Vibrio caribbeanicus ATCC BAA-2122]
MIYISVVLLLLGSIIYALWRRSLRMRVTQRLIGLHSQAHQDSAPSILRKATPSTGMSRLLVRLDTLFSTQDKALLLALLIGLPALNFMVLGMIDVRWRIALGLAATAAMALMLFVMRKKQQIEEFEQSMVQVLGLISRAVSAGLSVPQAISQVTESQGGLMSREFSRIEDQLALGHGMRYALNEACIRLPYKAFRYFTIALLLNQSNGGQLREILHSLSRTLHENRAMQKKVKSLTSEPRTAARFLSLLPLGLLTLVAWINPSLFLLLIETEPGQSVLIYCAVSILVGAITLHLMTKNKRFT